MKTVSTENSFLKTSTIKRNKNGLWLDRIESKKTFFSFKDKSETIYLYADGKENEGKKKRTARAIMASNGYTIESSVQVEDRPLVGAWIAKPQDKKERNGYEDT